MKTVCRQGGGERERGEVKRMKDREGKYDNRRRDGGGGVEFE